MTPTTLYAGTRDGGVFKSTDGGGNWSAVNTGLGDTWVTSLAIDPMTPTTIYAGTENGVFKSIDGGESWNSINNGSLYLYKIKSLTIDSAMPTTLYAGTDYDGLFALIVGH